jgi:DNA-binding phage protein
MTTNPTGGWAEIRERATATPELRAQYESTKRAVIETRRMLQELDAARERAGLSKAALAHQVGMDPSVVRRLFTAAGSNPSLHTVLTIMAALGLEMEVKAPRPRRGITPPAPRRGGHRREEATVA